MADGAKLRADRRSMEIHFLDVAVDRIRKCDLAQIRDRDRQIPVADVIDQLQNEVFDRPEDHPREWAVFEGDQRPQLFLQTFRRNLLLELLFQRTADCGNVIRFPIFIRSIDQAGRAEKIPGRIGREELP